MKIAYQMHAAMRMVHAFGARPAFSPVMARPRALLGSQAASSEPGPDPPGLDPHSSCPLPPLMADRAWLQPLEKPDRPQRTARRRRMLCQARSAGPSLDHPSAPAARRRTRGLSPLGRGLALAA